MARVGFIGLGKMGAVMAPRLLEGGHNVTVWNRSLEKCKDIESKGSAVAGEPSGVATASDIIITMLLDDAAVESIFDGPSGLLSVPMEGKLFIDMSTLRPGTVRSLSQRIEKRGARLVDAPVSGTVAPAKDGKLLALAGGFEEDIERARPVLDVLCRKVVHAGPVGQGALLKLVVNLPLAVYWQALAEAAALGQSGGLDLKLMLETIQDSSASLAVLGLKTPAILGKPGPVAFDTASMKKDLLSMLDTGKAQGVSMVTTEAVLAAYSAAIDSGYGDDDAVAVVRFLTDQIAKSDQDKNSSS